MRTGVEVKKVLLEKAGGHGGTNGDAVATGVEYTDLTTGTTTTVIACREVVVAAGAFGPPPPQAS